VILFVLFGGSVGGLIFLHYQYGSEAIKEILGQVIQNCETYVDNRILTVFCFIEIADSLFLVWICSFLCK
jgi:hypothetical protein